MPAGPRSLLQGERLIRKGQYAPAIEKLKIATELLPQNAQAWNHLGLAYHGAGQWTNAIKAYERALALSNNLAVARYNLGCLYLGQNNNGPALEEFKRFALLHSNSPEAWLKLAAAHLRLGQLDAAERSYNQALKISPHHPEALNGLGMVQLRLDRVPEAFQSFTKAVSQQPDYAPAVLNQAIVAHQYLNNRSLALQKYENYLSLKQHPVNRAAVERLAEQLRLELYPPPRLAANRVAIFRTNVTDLAMHRTNLVVGNQSNATFPAPAMLQSNVFSPSPLAFISKTNRQPTSIAPPPAHTNKAESSPTFEVVRLSTEVSLQPARDPISKAGTNLSASTGPGPETVFNSGVEPALRQERPSVLKRMNPASWFRSKVRSGSTTTPLSPVAPPLELKPGPKKDEPRPPQNVAGSSGKLVPPRYSYHPLVKLPPGDHARAEPLFSQAVQDQKTRRLQAAIEGYQAATRADPRFFEAYYNLGLAAYEAGDLALSLRAYENALSLDPNHVSSRYNFALALQQANYLLDASNELEKVLLYSPEEIRAHLSLANLYAQELDRPALARAHYLKVLAKEPNHSQAAAIRYWLASNR